MKIKIEKSGGGYRADFTEIPGSPPVGTGKTEGAAVATLFIRNFEWVKKLDHNYLEINGKPYEEYMK